MDWDLVRALLQSLSAIAIAMGLVYTAVQLGAWRKAQHVANFTKLVELQNELRRVRVDDPFLATENREGIQFMPPFEVRLYYSNLMQLGVFEIAWFSHKNGQLPDDYFESWKRNMSALAAEETFQSMWQNESTKILHEEFRHFVDGLIRRS